jgi:hypothetical protein
MTDFGKAVECPLRQQCLHDVGQPCRGLSIDERRGLENPEESAVF